MLHEFCASPQEHTVVRAVLRFEHFVPVRYDLEDLVPKLTRLLSHDEEAQRIAKNARTFAEKHLTYDTTLLYLDRMVRCYAALLFPNGLSHAA